MKTEADYQRNVDKHLPDHNKVSPPKTATAMRSRKVTCFGTVYSVPNYRSCCSRLVHWHLRDSQLSTLNCQLSTVSCQLSAVNCQLSTVSCQLSAVKCQLSAVNCQLSAVSCQLSAVSCQLSAVNCHVTPLTLSRLQTERGRYLFISKLWGN